MSHKNVHTSANEIEKDQDNIKRNKCLHIHIASAWHLTNVVKRQPNNRDKKKEKKLQTDIEWISTRKTSTAPNEREVEELTRGEVCVKIPRVTIRYHYS